MAVVMTASLSTVRSEATTAGNGVPAPDNRKPRPPSARPLLSVSKPTWIVKTEACISSIFRVFHHLINWLDSGQLLVEKQPPHINPQLNLLWSNFSFPIIDDLGVFGASLSVVHFEFLLEIHILEELKLSWLNYSYHWCSSWRLCESHCFF